METILFFSCSDSLDYEMANLNVTVFGSPLQTLCSSVIVRMDGRIEDIERFFIQLSSDDSAANVTLNQAELFISDSDRT